MDANTLYLTMLSIQIKTIVFYKLYITDANLRFYLIQYLFAFKQSQVQRIQIGSFRVPQLWIINFKCQLCLLLPSFKDLVIFT